MTVSYDISYFSLATSDPKLFQQAKTFYTELLNFKILSTSGDHDSIAWLCYKNDTCAENDIHLKLSIEPFIKTTSRNTTEHIQDLLDKLHSDDWRSLKISFVFRIPCLSVILQKLSDSENKKKYKYFYQVRPDINNPVEVYVIDPLSNLIGFTSVGNTFSSSFPAFHSLPQITALTEPNSHLGDNVVSGLKQHSSLISAKSTVKKIAVMTSGGDSPGMNSNVRAIVRTAILNNCTPYAIYEGYSGLVNGGPEYIKEMKWNDVRGWLREGGTNIGTARCKEFRELDGRLKACHNLIMNGIDALIVCGGDGSLTGADLFRKEWPELISTLLKQGKINKEQFDKHQRLNICGTVGSIDNDMSSTDATIGAYSSLARICEAVDYIDATANSHSRAFVIEVMGRHCGWLALMAGIATNADYILIPEKPARSRLWQLQMCDIVSKHRARGKRRTIVLVAEGAIAEDGVTSITSKDVADVLINKLQLDTRITTLGHVQRGGTAVAFDRSLATLQGVEAVNAVLETEDLTQSSPMIAIEGNKIVRRSLVEAVKLTKSVAQAINDRDFDKAMSLREPEFADNLSNFIKMNTAIHAEPELPENKRMNIAIVNIGAPASGVNSAVYSMATYCMAQGHTPYAIMNGFSGLVSNQTFRKLDWLEIVEWNSQGGSKLGTNRTTPSQTDVGLIAYLFAKYQIDGLIIVGGFEAFISLHELERARSSYPAFRIPMVLIPATLSNNVPGTEYSIGTDTCLNSLMDYCDTVKQSAAATRNRVFVVEIQGGNSGFIASSAQLIVGAQVSYVPEEGITIPQLIDDIKFFAESFDKDQGESKAGRLILKSINASKVFSTKFIAEIINSESNGRFEAKTAIPGHVQQGGIPTPIDRTRASKLACKSVDFIEKNSEIIKSVKYEENYCLIVEKNNETAQNILNTASVVGIQGTGISFNSISNLYDFETEIKLRMPKKVYWKGIREISDKLSGRQ